jgi:phage replication-related protein YjqB (UPF0714/DUF867 family)
MASSYESFKELREREIEGQDYRIRIDLKDEHVLVMAPHGGKIEPGTAEIAEAIAGRDYSFYSFEGLKADGNGTLHIESHLFDEPCALQAVEKADIVITVHGQLDQKDAFVMIGGLDDGLSLKIKHQLEASGFQTRPPTEGLGGTDSRNICNRGRSKCGVQLEISRKIRDSLRMNRDQLHSFASAIRRAIQLYLSSVLNH